MDTMLLSKAAEGALSGLTRMAFKPQRLGSVAPIVGKVVGPAGQGLNAVKLRGGGVVQAARNPTLNMASQSQKVWGTLPRHVQDMVHNSDPVKKWGVMPHAVLDIAHGSKAPGETLVESLTRNILHNGARPAAAVAAPADAATRVAKLAASNYMLFFRDAMEKMSVDMSPPEKKPDVYHEVAKRLAVESTKKAPPHVKSASAEDAEMQITEADKQRVLRGEPPLWGSRGNIAGALLGGAAGIATTAKYLPRANTPLAGALIGGLPVAVGGIGGAFLGHQLERMGRHAVGSSSKDKEASIKEAVSEGWVRAMVGRGVHPVAAPLAKVQQFAHRAQSKLDPARARRAEAMHDYLSSPSLSKLDRVGRSTKEMRNRLIAKEVADTEIERRVGHQALSDSIKKASVAGSLGKSLQGKGGALKRVGEHLMAHDHAYDLGGLGILAAPSVGNVVEAIGHKRQGKAIDKKELWHSGAELAGLGTLAAPVAAHMLTGH